MSTVLLVAHHERVEAAALARTATEWLAAHGHSAFMCAEDAAALHLPAMATGQAPGDADLAVSLGGDGTMLRTVKLVGGAGTPIIGVNVGLLGYLTEVEPDALCPALQRWFDGPEAGEWRLDERMLLDVAVAARGDQPAAVFTALNEGVVEKQESGHTVRLLVSIDGTPFTSYAADGLILATPTGSTAYSMSARGPVVSPRLRAVLLTPVSPHMLFDRTLVLDPGESVEVEVLGHRAATLSIDGQPAATLEEGDRVTVAPSSQVARFVRFGERRFHHILKAKFGLTDR
ncbi:MAG: NAD(+)/NADH kinase [Acidimicrobiaceae bacterium]|nr:NAD(+)/NADH kinase [Ilumatobacter sp.]MCB9379983.1 NAD(+)/NADH kinase [Acidimicrobiaceae bacterium]MCO5330638.1 NAD(+)/NADH kinase [Ilumatobacteraceae bacterium]